MSDEIANGIEIQPETKSRYHKRGQSRIVQNGDTAYVELTRGKWATIDAVDVPLVVGLVFHAQRSRKTFYAKANVRSPEGDWHIISMHRLIMGDEGEFCDHADGDGLNNRRINLRLATGEQNRWNRGAQANNTTGFKGVYYHKEAKKYGAFINAHGKQRYLGLFETAELAHEAYKKAAAETHQEFARAS